MKRKIVPIGLLSLLLGILFDVFFFDKAVGISLFLYSAFILGSTVYLATLFKTRLPRAVYFLMPVILFFALMVFIRASGMLLFFNTVLVLYLMLLIVQLSTRPNVTLQNYTVWQYFNKIPSLPFQILRESNTELRRTLVDPGTRAEHGTARPVIRGIIIALPILAIFIILLSSADLAFHQYVTNIFRFHFNGEFIWQVVIVAAVAVIFIGSFVLLYMRTHESTDETIGRSSTSLGSIEMAIVLGSVEVLFLLFLLVQATYLFGGNHHVQTTAFTYADYARHGFFELIAVAAISLLLIWFIKQSTRIESPKSQRTFKWLAVTLIAEVMIIMISAHSRLSLYEQTYGYTKQRLLAHMFIYWLAIAFILAAIHIIRKEKEQQFAFRLFLSVLAFFVVLNLVNPDALIARHNIARLQATGKLDAFSLADLSEDATPTVTQLLTSNAKTGYDNQRISDIVAHHLYQQKQTLDCNYKPWQSANLARMHAQKVLAEKDNQFLAAQTDFVHCTND